ncbi:MAG: DUF2892 domain-containing protein [Candidatus Gracilibacteria bacterium]|jgi:hypothetical protein
MENFINEGSLDRFGRIILAEILFIIGFFWLGSVLQIVFFVLSLILLVTGIVGFCPLYILFKINTCQKDIKISKKYWIIFTLLFVLIGGVGSYYSAFFTKKIFLEDYNRMNNYYKQTLFNTGKEKRTESIINYDALFAEYAVFLKKYTSYHPYALYGDTQWNNDITKVASIITDLKDKIYTGDLKQLHLDLEKVRPIFQDILKRNNFSMLAITLVDFHDAMEKVIEAADAKNATGVINAYIDANDKLNAIAAEANDAEIQAIRKNLDDIKTLAEQGQSEQLPTKAAELKSSFVKVYLKRG